MTTKFIENFIENVDNGDLEYKYETDQLVDDFWNALTPLTTTELTDIIISDIYIPDYYAHDSSQEKIFTKLVEVLTSFVFMKIGIKSEYLKTKSATEDIHLELENGADDELLHIVGDVKTYRLGRSQRAANVKDFVKPADFKDIWGLKYDSSCGLVIFPSTHEWKKSSDVYQHCTNPDYPIVMMHYSHLAVLLNSIENRKEDVSFSSLWDYSDLDSSQINNKDKDNYWKIFDEKFDNLFNVNTIDLTNRFESQIKESIESIVYDYEQQKKEEIEVIKERVETLDEYALRDLAKSHLIEKKVEKIETDIDRIRKFRLE